MTQQTKDAEKRGYSKGYLAGKKRVAKEVSYEQRQKKEGSILAAGFSCCASGVH